MPIFDEKKKQCGGEEKKIAIKINFITIFRVKNLVET